MNADNPYSDDLAELKALEVIWQATEPRRFDDEAMVSALSARMGVAGRRGSFSGKSLRKWVAYSAGAVAGLYMVVVGISQTKKDADSAVKSITREYVTRPGERATVILQDGTKVMLNVATRLRVSGVFPASNRVVYLDGEAQFTVTHNSSIPFIVQARGTSVRDLATIFVVRAYEGTSDTRVMVRDGRVAVQSPALTATEAVPVSAQQVATVASDGVPVISPMREGDGDFSWTNGELVLRQTPLGEALTMMSRWYGLEFRAGDRDMLSLSVSGRLPQNFNLQNVQYLADVIGATVIRAGNVVTLQPKQPRN